VTQPFQNADEVLAPLRALVDELTTQLAASDVSAEEAARLKQQIYVAHRQVEQWSLAVETLQAQVRELVAGWKGRFRASETPVPSVMPLAGAPDAESSVPAAPSMAATPAATMPAVKPGAPRVIDELNASTFVERGWSRIAVGDYVGAELALHKALDLHPTDAHAQTLLGWAQMSQGKYDEAMERFQQVLAKDENHALAHINVGYVLLRRRQHDAAVEHLSRAIALNSDRKATLYGHYYLGLVYLEQERYADAIASFERAIEYGPNLIEARFELGRVQWFDGQTDVAIATWRKGADANKFNAWSARCREMLATVADGGAPSRVA
jgi:tetratricopeptide (TPR) repeat protein